MTTKLLTEDLRAVIRALPKDIKTLMKEHNLFLGGGFIRETVRGERPHDIDLLGASEPTMETASALLNSRRGSRAKILKTKNAITIVEPPRTTVQFIHRWVFSDPIKCMESFDFTVCQAVVFWDEEEQLWGSVVHDRFYPDLASLRLTYTQPDRHEDAGGSMLRMRKFIHRGYHISADDMALVLARLTAQIDLEKAHDEVSQGRILRSLLREVDPLFLVDGIEPVGEEGNEE